MPCYIQPMKDGGTMFLCGDFGPHCGACASVGDFLCDFEGRPGIMKKSPISL